MSEGERFRFLRYPRLDVSIYRLDTAWHENNRKKLLFHEDELFFRVRIANLPLQRLDFVAFRVDYKQ